MTCLNCSRVLLATFDSAAHCWKRELEVQSICHRLRSQISRMNMFQMIITEPIITSMNFMYKCNFLEGDNNWIIHSGVDAILHQAPLVTQDGTYYWIINSSIVCNFASSTFQYEMAVPQFQCFIF